MSQIGPSQPGESHRPGDQPPRPAPPGSPLVTIRCREHGPLVVELPVVDGQALVGLRVTDHTGRELPLPVHKRAVALCRCGHTRSRPWCDGSHTSCGWTAPNTAPPADRETGGSGF